MIRQAKLKEKTYSENKLTFVRLFSELRNLYIDLLYGASLIGTIKSSKAGQTYVSNTDYSVLKWISKIIIQNSSNDINILDIGCGKDRAINGFHYYLTSQKRKIELIGIEYEKLVALTTGQRLSKLSLISIKHGDATTTLPLLPEEKSNYLFLFNPFSDEKIMNAFMELYLKTYSSHERYPTILYYCPRILNPFQKNHQFTIEIYQNKKLVPWKVDHLYRTLAVINVIKNWAH